MYHSIWMCWWLACCMWETFGIVKRSLEYFDVKRCWLLTASAHYHMYTFDVHVDDHVVLTSIAYACDSQLDPCLNSTIDQNRGLPVLVAITFANHFFNNSIDCACDWPSDPYLNSTIGQNRWLSVLVELTLTHRSFNNSIDGACDYPLDACSEDYMSPSGTAWGIPWAPLGDSLVVPLGGLLLTNRDVSSRPEGPQAAPTRMSKTASKPKPKQMPIQFL